MKIIENHHIIPKSYGGTDKDGRIYLCKSCHDIFHLDLTTWVREYVMKKTKFPFKR